MSQPQRSEPKLSNHDLNATGVLGASPADPGGKTDFAQLAAAFAQSGGGFSAELSSDLALEIVLNEIVVEACLMTGATGAAVALERGGEMICRGSSGSPAPSLGSRLDATWGLAAECIRTGKIQRSEDVLADPRVDLAASHRLGIRSVVVMPLVRADELMGLFELFSSLPQAFGERDERMLEALALRIYGCLESAAQPPPPPLQEELAPISEVQESTAERSGFINSKAEDLKPDDSTFEISPRRGFDVVTWALRFAVLVCAIMLALLLGRHFVGAGKARIERPHTRPHSTTASTDNGVPAAASPSTVNPAPDLSSHAQQQGAASVSSIPAPVKSVPPPRVVPGTHASLPPGSLQIFENGKEIFRMPPARHVPAEAGTARDRESSPSSPLGSGVQRASSAEPDREGRHSSAAAEGSLVRRVEPKYPEDALRQQIQGTVVLDVRIDRDGAVQDVRSVSGPPQLTQASTDAVKQWRFKPRRVNGRPSPMQTRVTLNFKLPQENLQQ